MSRRPRVDYLEIPRRDATADAWKGFVIGLATGAALAAAIIWPW